MRPVDYARIEQAILFLGRQFRRQPDLAEVARTVGMSKYRFQRTFTRWAGISPKRFLQYLTAEHARRMMRETPTVMDSAFEAGLSGPGRLHDLLVNVYAMTPGEMKKEGEGLTIRYGVHHSPFGDCLIAVTGRGICGLSFLPGDGKGEGEAIEQLRERWVRATLSENQRATGVVANRIFTPSLWNTASPLTVVVRGTNFQIRVWEALVRISPGCAVSYEGVASLLGSPAAARAVGSAVARNPVGFLIPCHRVIRKKGDFGDYRWGTTRKRAILAWEAARFRKPAGQR